MLMTLIFTVDNYFFFLKNQCIPRPVTIAIVYSHYFHTISLYHILKMLIILFYYTAISKEIILFVNQASLR